MLVLADWTSDTQRRAAVLLTLNIATRLYYPATYFPATASCPGVLSSPLTHRAIAFVAEFALYELWAAWIGVSFWSADHYLWQVVLVGELISNLGVVLQSELLLFLEDSTWAVHATYMTVLSYPRSIAKMSFFLAFALALVTAHLPRRFRKLMFDNPDLLVCNPLWSMCGMCKRKGHVLIQPCHHEEKAWVIPMMLGQAVMTPLMLVAINALAR